MIFTFNNNYKSKVLLPQVKLTITDLQLLNNVIIIKSKVLLPQVKLTIADLQLLNNVIIIKSKVLLPQVKLTGVVNR
jgi:metal-sulfur cluster biosynthetic enzyme